MSAHTIKLVVSHCILNQKLNPKPGKPFQFGITLQFNNIQTQDQ